MRSLLIGQQRAGQCDLLKWKVSFSGKPHLRCQTTQTQCWKMKILEGGRCIFRNKWTIVSCLVTCYILYNSWDLRLLSHVLYLSSTHWGSPSQCWLACSPSSVALSGLNAKVRAGISPPSTPFLDWQPCYGGLPLFSHHCRINMCFWKHVRHVSVYTRPFGWKSYVVLQDISCVTVLHTVLRGAAFRPCVHLKVSLEISSLAGV